MVKPIDPHTTSLDYTKDRIRRNDTSLLSYDANILTAYDLSIHALCLRKGAVGLRHAFIESGRSVSLWLESKSRHGILRRL